MSPIGGLLVFAIFPIVFTAWGWRYVVVPVVWPTIKHGFRLLMVLTWIGFGVGITGTGSFYRAFGFGLGDVVYAMAPTPEMAQQSRWEREDSITPEGGYMPGWRQRRYLAPLPKDWNGPVEHTSSPIVLLIMSAAVFGVFILVRLAERRRHGIGEMGATPRARAETLSMVERTMKPTHVQHTVAQLPHGWTERDHRDFTSALKHLGFGAKAIREVQRRVNGSTLQERITQALKYLTREHKV